MDGNDDVFFARAPLFGGEVDALLPLGNRFKERPAADAVDNPRFRLGSCRRKTADHAHLGAVEVDRVWREVVDEFFDLTHGTPIFQGVNFTNDVRQSMCGDVFFFRGVPQFAFTARRKENGASLALQCVRKTDEELLDAAPVCLSHKEEDSLGTLGAWHIYP